MLIKILTNIFFSRLIVVKTVFEKLADRLKEVIIIKLLKKHCLGPREGGRGRSIEVAVQWSRGLIFNNTY